MANAVQMHFVAGSLQAPAEGNKKTRTPVRASGPVVAER
jgi:hypothetical protein